MMKNLITGVAAGIGTFAVIGKCVFGKKDKVTTKKSHTGMNFFAAATDGALVGTAAFKKKKSNNKVVGKSEQQKNTMEIDREPLVSVIIATYRREESLAKAIHSLQEQSYNNIEIIIIDDNANEEWNSKVKEVINSFGKDARIKYICNETNQGSAKTRNIGINAAEGEYITFLDDDDVYLPKKIKNQLIHMVCNDSDYSLTDLALYNENESLSEYRNRSCLKSVSTSELLKYHLMHHLTGTDTMMFKKDYLTSIGGFDAIDVGDEFYLMVKAINAGGKFDYIQECDVKAFVHTGEGGLSSGDGKIYGENQLFEYKKQFFDELDSETIQYIEMRHYAVLAFAYIRMRKRLPFASNAMKSFVSNPIACVELVVKRRKTS